MGETNINAPAPKDKEAIPFKAALILGAAIFSFVNANIVHEIGFYGFYFHGLRALIAVIGLVNFMVVCAFMFRMTAKIMNWQHHNKATGLKGTARWAKWREVKKLLSKTRSGIFLGAIRRGLFRKAIVCDFESNAVCIAPSGSGKGIYTLINTAISIIHNKVIIDFKGELSCILVPIYKALGWRCVIINLANKFPERLGETDYLNPLSVIYKLLFKKGGLEHISDDTQELCIQLSPDPKSGNDNNVYFKNGARKDLTFVFIFLCLIHEDQANIGMADIMLNDRNELIGALELVCGELVLEGEGPPENRIAPPLEIEIAQWVENHDAIDVENFIKWFRALAAGLLTLFQSGDTRTSEPFLAGAQQATERFNLTTRANKLMSKSTFDLEDLKNTKKKIVLFFILDAGRLEAQADAISLWLWMLLKMIKQHPNPKAPIYLLCDEATNFFINQLGSLLTWGRGFGLRHFLIFQDKNALTSKYSEDTWHTLISQSEIVQYLPGQRSDEMIDLIVKRLGEQGIMHSSYNGDKSKFRDIGGHSLGEEARALMNANEVRETNKVINFVGKTPAFLTEPIKYAEILPWALQVGNNPFHGNKRFLKFPKLIMFPRLNFWRHK